ncbi:glucose-6-phosphate isomerase [Actinoplanes sp. RD1]|uniref:glucose-6-phosphate isomerase n=1 Tax=Actinoplanes sp. RD1 TaxID=3064538 RepID=UPI0027408E18|nr:glucose-6-phosphate isomerase [Actinoplanes sp. RD1]
MTTDLLAAVEAAAGLAVFGAPAAASRREPVVARLAGLGTEPVRHALTRGRELLPQLAELHDELGDLDHVVLTGPGRAAEAVARTLGLDLTVLDGPDPARVCGLLEDEELLRRTVTVLGAGSEDLRRVLLAGYLEIGLTEAEAARHFVATSGPEPLLTGAEGLAAVVAVSLAGADVTDLLDQADRVVPSLEAETDNPALSLGLALAGADAVALVNDGTGLEGLAEWIAPRLTAAGLVPVAAEGPDSPGARGEDVTTIAYGGSLAAGTMPGGRGTAPDIAVNGPLGAQFVVWHRAAEIAARLRGARPHDPAGDAGDDVTLACTDGGIEIFTTAKVRDTAGALRELTAGVHDHLSVVVLLDPASEAELAGLRPLLAAAAGRPVTLDTAPETAADLRNGSFLQVTGADAADVAVPGTAYTLGELRAARAAAARRAVTRHGRPLLRLHLADRADGVARLLAAARMLRA